MYPGSLSEPSALLGPMGEQHMAKTSARAIAASVIGLIVVLILFNTLNSGEWYHFEGRQEGERVDMEFGLDSVSTSHEGTTNSSSYEEDPWEGGKVSTCMNGVKAFMIIGIVVTVIFQLLALLVGTGRLIPGNISLFVGMIAFIAVIMGPVYLVLQLPGAWEENAGELGFDKELAGPWDEFKGEGTDTAGADIEEISYGPMWAFITTIIAGVALILPALLCIGIPKHVKVEYNEEESTEDEFATPRPVVNYGHTRTTGPEPIKDFFVTPEEMSRYGGGGYEGYSAEPLRYGGQSYAPSPASAPTPRAHPTFCQNCRQLLRADLDHCAYCGAPIWDGA